MLKMTRLCRDGGVAKSPLAMLALICLLVVSIVSMPAMATKAAPVSSQGVERLLDTTAGSSSVDHKMATGCCVQSVCVAFLVVTPEGINRGCSPDVPSVFSNDGYASLAITPAKHPPRRR
ncbi:hypothetical protein [Aestuariispira ectoiniformans]|uniref:hypothetical protein n=1 Tax=Aestuariispira ectoiniformans TaxID=2775080 RepID=UPI00223BA4E7|nr:hypothetical protein [Aestuariispira ectoiniformans]